MVTKFLSLLALATILTGCAGYSDPIWVRQNAPAPVVTTEGGSKLSLRPGTSVCLQATKASGGQEMAFLVRANLTKALKPRGIETNTFNCDAVIRLNIRFVGQASATAADQMLAAGYGGSVLSAESTSDVEIGEASGVGDILVGFVRSITYTAKPNYFNVAVVDVDAGNYHARFVSRDQGEPNHDQQFYLSESLALQIAGNITR